MINNIKTNKLLEVGLNTENKKSLKYLVHLFYQKLLVFILYTILGVYFTLVNQKILDKDLFSIF